MDRREISKRLVLPAAAATAFAALAILRVNHQALYDRVLVVWGIWPFRFPFVDIHGVLSAIQCSARGVDVYVTNPCDALGRVFFYSPLLLWAAPTGIGIGATPAAGLIIDAAFILSLALLPPARRFAEGFWLAAATLSTMTVFALERANIDALVFAIIAASGALLLRSGRVRFAGYAAITVAALIKFYPAILFILALRERPRVFLAVSLAAATVLAVFAVAYHQQIAMALANVPHGFWFSDMFGAVNLPYGLAKLGFGSEPRLLWLAFVAVATALAVTLGLSPALATAQAALTPREAMLLVTGVALIAGCFFAGQSIGYRGIFLILTVPGLTALARAAVGRSWRVLFGAMPLLVVLLMWGECFHHAITFDAPHATFVFWLGRELVWWFVMAVFGGILLRFVLTSAAVRAAARLRLAPGLIRAPLGLPGERNPS